MTGPAALDWAAVSVAVFDVDGTLYDQGRLRRKILPRLLLHAGLRADIGLVRIISALRTARERMAEAERSPFEAAMIAEVAEATGATPERVRAVLVDWLERRPLPLLAPCMLPGAAALFEALRAAGRPIAVLSDYPAEAKLDAMGLRADLTVAATDPGVEIQKPHPRGLERIAAHFGVAPGAMVMIGDRAERDGAAAARCGAPSLIRGRDFADFTDPVFAGAGSPARPAGAPA